MFNGIEIMDFFVFYLPSFCLLLLLLLLLLFGIDMICFFLVDFLFALFSVIWILSESVVRCVREKITNKSYESHGSAWPIAAATAVCVCECVRLDFVAC